ncbi:MAG: DUF1622 domain-containing protein [Burkholderiaceae bacterium]
MHKAEDFIMVLSPSEVGAEDAIVNSVLWLKLAVESVGALVIGIGMVATCVEFARTNLTHQIRDRNSVRLTLARYMALALEFQLGADILATSVAPSWDMIGKLGAIAVLRTALNYFLTREMQQEGEAPGPAI